ncbi:outer membrane lipoprotein-sorting protein [Rhodothalassium salexigens DSM 2132]|nr:outer membrane lipoprotein-sorting protein [Rhodothalassium salexigens DSM 2132]
MTRLFRRPLAAAHAIAGAAFVAALALPGGLTPGAVAQDLTDAQAIVDRASAASYYQGPDGRARVHMSITDAQGRERSRDFTILRTDIDDRDNGEQRFYVHFSRPADVNGTVFMVWKHVGADDDRWLYLPALDLVKRIAASDERTSFVGSHFFYEDVSGRGPREDTHSLAQTTDTYYVVDSEPKDPSKAEFARYRNYIHKDTFLPVKTEYFDGQGKVYRTYTVEQVETIDGHPTVTRARMADSQIGGATVMRYSSVAYDVGLPQDVFTERYLRNPPRQHLR